MAESLAAYYRCADTLRSRSVSPTVLSATLDVPVPSAWLLADWARDIAQQLCLDVGDVEELSLARARRRWPDYARCVQAVADWTRALGLQEVLASSPVALMACRAAHYHHDGVQYGGAAFCNLFLSEDKGLDLHFASSGQRIPLCRGTVVLFDTGQPHAVVARHSQGFDPADFAANQDLDQVFLTWELPIEDPHVTRALGIAFDGDVAGALQLEQAQEDAQVQVNGTQALLCPQTGRWLSATALA